MFTRGLDYYQVGPTRWRLNSPLVWHKRWTYVEVPKGYTTDFASVPQVFRRWFPKHARYSPAAVIHDYIYTDLTDRFSREQADHIFYDCLLYLGTKPWRARLMYYAVRVGGRGGWKKSRTRQQLINRLWSKAMRKQR